MSLIQRQVHGWHGNQLWFAMLTCLLSFRSGPGWCADESAVPIGTKIKRMEFKDIRYVQRSLDDLGATRGLFPVDATSSTGKQTTEPGRAGAEPAARAPRTKAYVFVFINTTCPLVQKYMPRLLALDEEYRREGVRFVAVNSGAGDSIREMASHSLEFGALFPFVKDALGSCARTLGVQRTPTAVILDSEHRLVYRGRIDDQYRIGGTLPKARKRSLQAAMDDVLSGRPVRVAETAVDGCQITFPIEPAAADLPKVTYAEHVAPVIRNHCAVCHHQGTAAPFSLLTFKEVASHGAMIAEVVGQQSMPPWFASGKHGSFQNDRTLSEQDRLTIHHWVQGGMLPGNSKSTVPIKRQPESKWRIGKPDLVISMLVPHSVPAEGLVPYKYTVLPYVFLKSTWVEAVEILPDNRRVVHHANLAYGAKGEKPSQSTFITGFVPGGQALDLSTLDKDVGFHIPALSVLGLQIHYTTTGKREMARISVGLRFKKGVVRKQMHFNLIDPRRFRIPPNHPAYAIRSSFVLKQNATMLGLFTHMHVRGKDMTFVAHRPNGTRQVLLEIPNYNFDWQIGYEVEPGTLKLEKGTRIEAIAHFDNSAFNPYNPDPNETVRYGPQTMDEMFNGFVFYTYDNEKLNLRIDGKTGWEVPVEPGNSNP
ncbi:MAG TPA: redoxin domain-containing protein [Planctomycetes bacterium]|nr:redoxin domain-containing protein [Planctomycetota bacterium]